MILVCIFGLFLFLKMIKCFTYGVINFPITYAFRTVVSKSFINNWKLLLTPLNFGCITDKDPSF